MLEMTDNSRALGKLRHVQLGTVQRHERFPLRHYVESVRLGMAGCVVFHYRRTCAEQGFIDLCSLQGL